MIGGFVALALATLSMFVSFCFVMSPVHQEHRYMEHMRSSYYKFSAVSLRGGTLDIGRHRDGEPPQLFKIRNVVSSNNSRIECPIHYENFGESGVLHVSLVSIGLIFILVYLLLSGKAVRIRRNAILAAHKTGQ